ncbi:IS1595 family transposase [Pseudoalteromonas sp. CnMc7-15]|uniref:IS1595 family transposase n=1 Tax=unclassified Pseudoalteromonas TaxID=194690 RepID=UPI001EF6E716|nr:IS1595 family transposase [Pseudoalteromonas sp. CnMc7-15]MCG7568194.1 IS1595 family transposase [Pseudoalteromonas sp. CnMc7-15]
MSQHFLLSKEYRDISLHGLLRMTDEELFEFVRKIWSGNKTAMPCTRCGAIDKHSFLKSRKIWQCKHCNRGFSLTSGTVWADMKLPLSKLVMIIHQFCTSANGISAVKVSEEAGVTHKTAWVVMHKLRETIMRSVDETSMSGEIHIDGGHFGGKPRSGQFRPSQKARWAAAADKLAGKTQGIKRRGISRANYERKKRNRRIVMVARQVVPGEGANKTRVFLSSGENEAIAKHIAQNCISKGSLVRTDENKAYESYDLRFQHETVEHSKEYSTIDGVNNNQAESYFSRLRRCEYGTTHRMQAAYMIDYAHEMAWKEDWRRKSACEKLVNLLERSFSIGLSRWWRGYWQGYRRNDEMLMA